MKEEILQFLANEERAYTLDELIKGLNIEYSELQNLKDELEVLIMNGDIYFTKREKYMLFKYCHLKKGIIKMSKNGDGYIMLEDKKVRIPKESLNGAIDKDLVDIEINDSVNPIEGKVIKIVKREYEDIPGEVIFRDNKYYIVPNNPKLRVYIEVKKENLMDAVVGSKVLVKLNNDNKTTGRITKVIGHKDDPGMDIELIAYEHNIPVDYDEEAMDELNKIPSSVLKNEYENKVDLTNEVIFTIDGDDTKDIDDAIGIIKNDDDTYTLKVCIANVSYYVGEKSNLNKEALKRGNSVYLANKVIPMLPHYLSNGICSLNPNVDRLSICCEMKIDKNGNVIYDDIYECVIKSRKQMTYKCVNKVLEEGIITEGYEEFVNDLNLMKELSDILSKNKHKRGYIDFDQDEAKVVLDDNGKCIDVVLRNRGIGERIIEDFMIVANETIASRLSNMELPCVYRVHEYPEEEKIDEFIKYVSLLGYKLNGRKHDISPKSMQKVLEELKDTNVYQILSNKLLRCMTKAFYSTNNVGHYGLASKDYCHFTSPIRRYADLLVHRIIRRFLIDNDYSNKAINEVSSNLESMCNHISKTERKAIDAEREVDKMFMAQYMEDHIGDIYKGTIVSMAPYGIYVSLPNKIEGLIHVSELGEGFYEYNEVTETMTSRDGRFIYHLGDEVEVEVVSASKIQRTIDFKIYKNNEKKLIKGK